MIKKSQQEYLMSVYFIWVKTCCISERNATSRRDKKKLPLVVYRNFDRDHAELGTLESD